MSAGVGRGVRVVPFGDSALLVELADVVDERINAAVHALADLFVERRPVPGYASLLVPFDSDRIDPAELTARLERAALEVLGQAVAAAVPERIVTIPVRYGGSDGPDMAAVAAHTGLHPDDVVALHAGTTYRVFMLGFAPGFAYLGTLPDALVLPRRDEPRVRVPAGSVAIAARQTAVYPFSTAGGWHILGRSDLRLWDAEADPPALLRPTDGVRFRPA